jgi:protein TonB
VKDRAVIAGAVVLSAALHLGALSVSARTEAPAIEGGASSAEPAQLGNSFRDMAQGSQASRPTEAPVPLSPAEPEATAPTPRADPVAATVAPVAAQLVIPPTTPAEPPAQAPEPVTTAAPAPAEPEAVVTATAPPEALPATPDTPRPAPRPDRAARPPEPPVQPVTRAASAPGAQQAERRGQDEGRETAAALQSDPAPAPTAPAAQGNATASSYPGLVMRQLSRTQRPQAGRRGNAVVGFEIGAGGEVRQAVILRSSGHEAIDRAAIEHVRRAAPFPPPPQGAERRFQVRYESRG